MQILKWYKEVVLMKNSFKSQHPFGFPKTHVNDLTIFEDSMLEMQEISLIRNSGVPKIVEFSKPLLDTVRNTWLEIPLGYRALIEAAFILPVSYIGLSTGLVFCDAYIPFLGMGWHRYFLFHSALSAYLGQQLLRKYDSFRNKAPKGVMEKITGGFLASGSFGIGVHLLADGLFGLIDGQKTVVFGIPGIFKINTLIRGTYLDDNIYLLGNSFWAFHIARDILSMTFPEEIEKAGEFLKKYFMAKTSLAPAKA
jgi:hypothetical protein